MAGEIKNTDLFGKDLLKPTIEEFKTLIKLVGDLKSEVVDLAKVNKKIAQEKGKQKSKTEEITKQTEAQREAIRLAKEKQKLELQEKKLTEQLNKVQTGQLDNQIKLRAELQKANKETKERIKEENGLLSTYEKESKRLNDLRKQYKNLRLEQGKSTKETEELRKELEELDKTLKDVDAEAGQFQRNVGNYPKATEGAKKGFASLSGFLLGTLASSFTKSRETSREFTIILEKIGTISRTVVAGLVETFNNKLLPSINNFFLSIQKNKLEVQLFFKELVPESLRNGEDAKAIADLTKEVEKLGTQIEDNQEIIDNAKNPFSKEELDKSTDAIKENLKIIEALGLAEAELSDTRERLNVEIERARLNEEKFQITADDSTLSFKQQSEALKEALKFREQRLALEKTLADEELRIAVQRVNVNLRENKLATIKNVEDAKKLDLFKEFDKADKVQQENLTRLAEAIKVVDAIDGERINNKLENEKQAREIARDLFEQELDFAIDIFDNQRTINERIIADDTKTFKERFKLLEETKALNDSSFESQKALIEDIAGTKLDFDKLIAESDEAVVREQLKNAGLNEIVQNRLLEVIRDRKTANAELLESERDLNAEFEENAEKRIEAQRDLVEFRKEVQVNLATEELELQKEFFSNQDDFQQSQFDATLDALENQKNAELQLLEQATRRELANLELSEEEKALIKAEAEEEKRQILEKSLQAEQDLRDEANAKIVEDAKATAEQVSEVLDFIQEKQRENHEQRLSDIDAEVDASKEREQRLREIAKDGIIDADENLAFEQRKQAELELEKEKEMKRQEKRELGFTALKTYTSKVEAGDENPLLNTIKDITLLMTAIDTISGFYEGSDHVGADLNPAFNTGKDDYLIKVDGDEKVFKPEHSRRIGYDMTNEDVVGIVERFKRGEMVGSEVDSVIIGSGYQSNDAIINKLDAVEKAIKSQPVQDFKYNDVEKAITTITTERNKVVRNHVKQKGIW